MVCLALWIIGCGAAPVERPTRLSVAGVVDGAVVHGCAAGARAWILRPWAVEHWAIEAAAPPRWLARAALPGPGQAAPAVGIACGGERATVALADGRQVHLLRGARASAALVRGAAWPSARTAPKEWTQLIADGRLLAGGPWGWGIRTGAGFSFWRGGPAGLTDATWDGRSLWAAGQSGLWRWRPGQTALAPVVLPAGLAAKPLRQVFRDGALHWVRDVDGRGWPLQIRGLKAERVGKVGPLAPQDPSLRVPWRGGVVEAREGQADLRWQPASGPRLTLAERPVHALAVTEAGVWVGTEDGLRPWRGVPPRPGQVIKLGVPARKVLVLGSGRLLVVTRDHGLFVVKVQR